MPQLGVEPATQACPLTGKRTHNLFGVWGDTPANRATQARTAIPDLGTVRLVAAVSPFFSPHSV